MKTLTADDAQLGEMALAIMSEPQRENRFNPNHDAKGQFATSAGHGGTAPLTQRQYEALRPQPYSRDLELGTQMELEETDVGKDLVGAIRRHTETFTGCTELSEDVWKVAKGGSTGNAKRDREARALIEAVRHAPDDSIPAGKLLSGKTVPGKLHRGIAVDDIESFAAKHKPGSTVELSSTAWSRDKSQTNQYSHVELDGWHPVTITLDTSNGAKALPVQNLMHYPENHALQEFITMGRFEVVKFGERQRGEYEMTLRQTGVL